MTEQATHTPGQGRTRARRANCVASLPVPVQKLHLKETGLQSEVAAQRGGLADAQSQVRKLQCDIAELADAIQDPKALKEKVGVVVAVHSADRSRQQ